MILWLRVIEQWDDNYNKHTFHVMWFGFYTYPANKIRQPNVVLMLDQRRRRWPNIETTFPRHVS